MLQKVPKFLTKFQKITYPHVTTYLKQSSKPQIPNICRKRTSKLYRGLDTEVEEGFDNSGTGGFSSLSLVPERNG